MSCPSEIGKRGERQVSKVVDTLAILGCVTALVGSYVLLCYSRCQHYRISMLGQRCVDCGMRLREIQVNHLLGLDVRKGHTGVCHNDCPFDPVFQYLICNLVENPDKRSPMMYVERIHLDPKAPPRIKGLYESMMLRRHGIAWLWKKHHAC